MRYTDLCGESDLSKHVEEDMYDSGMQEDRCYESANEFKEQRNLIIGQ